MNRMLGLFLCASMLCLLCAPALAIGPVKGEIGAVWWANDFDAKLDGAGGISSDAGAPGFRGEIWMFGDYGVRAAMFESDPDGAIDKTDYTSIDLMWKAFSPTENNYVAFGVGWEDADLAGIDTSGARLSVEGSVGILTVLQAYGQASFLPSLDDSPDGAGGQFEDVDGHEYEVGVAWNAAPLINVRAGYRETSFDYTWSSGAVQTDGSNESKGFLVGLGVRF